MPAGRVGVVRGLLRRVAGVLAGGSRWLNANLAWLVAAAIALGAAVGALGLVADVVGDEGAVVSVALAQRVPIERIPELEVPASASLEVDLQTGDAVYHVASASLPLRVLAAAGELLVHVLIFVGALIVAGVSRRLSTGRPFDPRVSRAMFTLVLVFIVGAIAPAVLDHLAATALFQASGVSEIAPVSPVGVDVHLGALSAAVLVAVLTQAFRRGQRLERDVEGLV